MDSVTKIEVLRKISFMQMIEAMTNYEKHGIRDAVINDKRERDLAEGPAKCAMFGLQSPEDFLNFSMEAFNCVQWELTETENGFDAETKSCVACHMAKEAKAPSICEMHCINPFLAVIKGINPEGELTVKETLWEGNRCLFNVKR